MKNSSDRQRGCILCATGLLAIIFWLPAQADQIDDIYRVAQSGFAEAKKSQQRINKLHDSTEERFQEYRQTIKEVEGLRVYNVRLQKQIEDQHLRLAEIDKAISDAVVVQRQLPALMSSMIDTLAELIELDVPFHRRERADRISFLKSNLNRSDVSTAEKFRQVMEAYKIESEYGRKIDSYKDSIQINGQKREVNIMRVGRIALMYQTTDGKLTGVWDQRRHQWHALTERAWRNAVLRGLRIARKQAAIELLRVPLLVPQSI